MESRKCCMVGCENAESRGPDGENRAFYVFPTDFNLCMLWVQNSGRPEFFEDFAFAGAQPFLNRHICSEHFKEKDFVNPKDVTAGLLPGAIPNLNFIVPKIEVKEEQVDPGTCEIFPEFADTLTDTLISESELLSEIKAEKYENDNCYDVNTNFSFSSNDESCSDLLGVHLPKDLEIYKETEEDKELSNEFFRNYETAVMQTRSSTRRTNESEEERSLSMETYEQEQESLRRLMEDVATDEEIQCDDESDPSRTDSVEGRENSDTEQDISENESDAGIIHNGLFFLGKDKATKWMKHAPAKNTRIKMVLPGSNLPTRSLKTPDDIFNYFVNDEMIEMIARNTNLCINSISDNFQRECDTKPTDAIEIRAFLGLLLYSGVLKVNRLNIEELWQTDGTGIEIFRLVMSLKRFQLLSRCLRFDDKDFREERRKTDQLAPIRELFDIFVDNCRNGYSLSEYVTVGEKLEGFKGRCSFRQCIPSKVKKYGIKIFALCDAKMYYTSIWRCMSAPSQTTGSGRNVTIDSWFTSVPLVNTLLSDFKLTVVGAIRKNKPELPPEFTDPKLPIGGSMFGYTETITLVSYVPEKKKSVLLVSSLHHNGTVHETTGKPDIVTDYDATKDAVQVVERLCANYSTLRNTRRWPMVIFYVILNIAGINSQVVYHSNNPGDKTTRRSFLKSLSMSRATSLTRETDGRESSKKHKTPFE
ncbi:hypothetical protein NQ318_013739 [Aromia moschata]|uniref:THAP-type domain-containing protein n=1 Tax=Aromia moschata TaxID=1265417 RepID=A0AAV8Z8E9_9CUCU|nr:hypothetical protein NQ318_013739 [Aromia moschata]